MQHTLGPWVFGSWTILDEDRPAQQRREPYWTLTDNEHAGTFVLAKGPYGRKAMDTEAIIYPTGYEADGLAITEADKRLISAAPELLKACKMALSCMSPEDNDATAIALRTAIEKAGESL